MSGPQGPMKNPPNARLYVGGVSNTATSKDLEDTFSKHGKILEVRMNRNFAFVQFSDESEATAAMKEENGKMYFGRKIDVQYARAPNRGNQGPGDQGMNKSMDQSRPPPSMSQDNMENQRDRSPLRDNDNMRDSGRFEPPNMGRGRGRSSFDRAPGWGDQDSGPMGGSGGRGRGGPGGMGRGGFRGDRNDSGQSFRQSDSSYGNDSFRGGGMDNFRGNDGPFRHNEPSFRIGSGPGGDSPFNRAGPNDSMRQNDNSFRGGPPPMNDSPFRGGGGPPRDQPYRSEPPPFRGEIKPPPDAGKPPTHEAQPLATANNQRVNDIEIIVLNRSITDYGEFIERKLKALCFTVDVLFPNEGFPIGRLLGNIASRGTLYAIIVSSAHQQNRSLTLHILHGRAQEHRNMPVDDAVTILSRNFDLYMKQCKTSSSNKNSPPENIRHMLEQILSGRELTAPQYDKLAQFFNQEKNRVEPVQDPMVQEAELQNRILNILNNKTSTVAAPPVEPAQPLLNDPTVQKALDNLMQGDLLRKIGPQHSYNRI